MGAGPSGLILGLLLSKQGIQVELLDAGAELDKQPRAAHYASPAAYELARAGVLEDVKARGFLPQSFAWRKLDTTFVAGLNHAALPPDYPYKMVVLPLDRLGKLLYEHIQRQPKAEVKWSHKVVRIGQDQEKAWVEIESPSGLQRSEADYVVGCDGASSTVRQELFGPEYPGETLNAQIIATNVRSIALDYLRMTIMLIGPTRCIMILNATDTGTAILSSTRRTGIWRLASRPMDCTACHMETPQALVAKNILLASHRDTKKSFPAIRSRENIASRISVPTGCSNDARPVSASEESCSRQTRPIFATHCKRFRPTAQATRS